MCRAKLCKSGLHTRPRCYVVPTSLLGARDRGCGCGSGSPICLYASMPLCLASMSACMPACLMHACMHACSSPSPRATSSFYSTFYYSFSCYSYSSSFFSPSPRASCILLPFTGHPCCLPSVLPYSKRSFPLSFRRSSYAFLLLPLSISSFFSSPSRPRIFIIFLFVSLIFFLPHCPSASFADPDCAAAFSFFCLFGWFSSSSSFFF